MSNPNPFASPTATEQSNPPGYGAPPDGSRKRPASPMVFGVLSIVFGVLGILGGVVNLAVAANVDQQEILDTLGFSATYMLLNYGVSFLVSIALLIAGIALVRYRDWGRKLFNGYAWFTIVWAVASMAYLVVLLVPNLDGNPAAIGGLIGGVFGGLFQLLFPVLGLIFLNQPGPRAAMS